MTLSYKGYVAGPISYEPGDATFHGTVAGLRDLVHFSGDGAAALEDAFRGSIDDYLDFCAGRGEEPDRT